jgi:hypothetical protein
MKEMFVHFFITCDLTDLSKLDCGERWSQLHLFFIVIHYDWILESCFQAGWPDWAKFRLLGDCLLWEVCSNLQK